MTEQAEATETPVDLPSTSPTEPSMNTGTAAAFAGVIINSLILFGIPLSTNTKVVIVLGVTLLLPIVVGVLVRRKVFSPASVDKIVAEMQKQIETAKTEATNSRMELVAAQAAHQASMGAVRTTVTEAFPALAQGLLNGPVSPPPAARVDPVADPATDAFPAQERPVSPRYDRGSQLPPQRYPNPPRTGRHSMRSE
jgi:hypothetical protein